MMLFIYVALFFGSVSATPYLKGTFERDVHGLTADDNKGGNVQVAATPALEIGQVSSSIDAMADKGNHSAGCQQDIAQTVSTLFTTTETRHVKRAIVETEINVITSTVTSAKVEPTSVTVINATSSSAVAANVFSSTTVPVPTVSTTSSPVTTVSTPSSASTTSKTDGWKLADIRDDFLASLKDAVRKVVTFSVGVMLSPFLIGAHRVQAVTTTTTIIPTTTPNSLESNQIDTN